MKRTLRVKINSGDKRCYSEPGKPCKYVGSKSFGTKWLCMLFPSELHGSYTILEESEGWLLRCKACLENEEKGE